MPVKAIAVQSTVRRGAHRRWAEAPEAVRCVDAAIEPPWRYPGTLRVTFVVSAGLEVFLVLAFPQRDDSVDVDYRRWCYDGTGRRWRACRGGGTVWGCEDGRIKTDEEEEKNPAYRAPGHG